MKDISGKKRENQHMESPSNFSVFWGSYRQGWERRLDESGRRQKKNRRIGMGLRSRGESVVARCGGQGATVDPFSKQFKTAATSKEREPLQKRGRIY